MKYRNNISIMAKHSMIAVVIVLVAQGCDNTRYYPENASGIFTNNTYNNTFRDFSLAVVSAMNENPEFRKLIREEALEMNDGDYDVLLTNIAGEALSAKSGSSKSMGCLSVKELLNRHFAKTVRQDYLKSSSSPIDDLLSEYPDLQISVPVNAEEWDPGNYIPVVTFLPLEYDELSTMELTAYTPDGDTVLLDAVTPPDDPVIVVSLSERYVSEELPEAVIEPPIPLNLTSSLTESGIRLSWSMPDSTDIDNTEGYYVYRLSSESQSYTMLTALYGSNNRSYNDYNVVSAASYSYFIIAFNGSEVSSPSNYVTVTAPFLPKPVTSFDAIQHAKNEVELRWQNDNSQYILETRIYKHVIGVSSEYVMIGSYPANQSETMDHNIDVGKKTLYKVHHVTALGESNPKYDFIQAPYRDISQNSPIYIKQIKFSDWELERWPAGKPEFYITVTNVDALSKTPYKVQDQMDCQFTSRSKTSQIFTGKKVLDWKPGFWYDMLTFTALEYDRTINGLKMSIGVKFNSKDLLKLNFLEATAGVQFEIDFKDKGEICGNSYYDYFSEPESWLIFPNYGVQILVSESDN